jgi:hypothetical protein
MIVGSERASELRLDAEEREVIRRHDQQPDPLGPRTACEVVLVEPGR